MVQISPHPGIYLLLFVFFFIIIIAIIVGVKRYLSHCGFDFHNDN